MLVAGIDVGAGTAKFIVLKDGKTISRSVMPITGNISNVVEKITRATLEQAGISRSALDYVVSTGYGRSLVPFAHRTMTEIMCHARGVHFLVPQARTIIDIGTQDSKVIRVDGKGRVTNFVMNDKCAAGTGRFLEVMSQVLGVQLEEMGRLSLTSQNPSQISSTCTVFAETEVVSLRAEGKEIQDLIAGIHLAIAKRVVSMGLNIKFEKETAFTGGVAKNIGVKKALEEVLGVPVVVPPEPQTTGALGAALEAMAGIPGK
jgi:predicted CoA-substrate-specific enzyme activase